MEQEDGGGENNLPNNIASTLFNPHNYGIVIKKVLQPLLKYTQLPTWFDMVFPNSPRQPALTPGDYTQDYNEPISQLFSQLIQPLVASSRLYLTEDFYLYDQLGYGFSNLTPLAPDYGFGRSQIDFTKWESERVNKSVWWNAMNAKILQDMYTAHFLYSTHLPLPTTPEVNAWLNYMNSPNAENWYQAHNMSVVSGYLQFEDLALQEVVKERILMTNVLNLVLYAQRLVITDGISTAADPSLFGVDLITDVQALYPPDYPLDPYQAFNVLLANEAIQAIMGHGYISYAGITPEFTDRLIQGAIDSR